ncbi:MAG TPA: PQQ-binding-like beta-propeller repeat protein [Bacteroidales bacterium]|nr:PQQ-binding-like beta-propeller repeat protein [Bacteroidales bacterium]
MKKLLIILFLCCYSTILPAQYTYTFTIKDTKSQPVAGKVVTAQNTEKNIELKSTTDNSGTARFTLAEPGTYTFSYLELKDVATFEVIRGGKGTCARTVTYDPEKIFEESKKAERTGITFAIRDALQLKGQPNTVKAVINIKENNGKNLPAVSFEMVDCPGKIKYKAITNTSGLATFYLPVNKEYEVDIEGHEALRTFKVPKAANLEISEVFYYERTNVKEVHKGDTIIQKPVTQANGTSTHLLFTLYLKNFEGLPLPDEEVYLAAEKNSAVYAGRTDANGKCTFLLKKGSNYLVNLKYEQGVFLVEAPAGSGFGSSEVSRRYRGSRAIEKMMAERHINEKGFVVNHAETPVHPAKKPVNYFKKTDTGFEIDFSSSGPVGTPSVADNKLFSQEGFYSPNFYCLQAATGAYLWGLELGESGASPIVFHDGILLINTYSCTLYAINASSGKLLWSKWLAGTIYSTPSADSNSVYVVYDNGYDNPAKPNESYVAASFDLHTGIMNWVNWIDNEVIACPVIEGKEVHIASQSGNYYVFDKVSGKQTQYSDKIKAVSSPTVTPDKIYITASVNGKEQLMAMDRNTLQIQKKYSAALATPKIIENRSCYNQMNFNGTHPVVYKNNIILLSDSMKLMAFDANSEKILWQQAVKLHPNQIPIVMNDNVIVATTTGEIKNFDISTGVLKKTIQGKGKIDGQVISYKNQMYIGSEGALSVSGTTQNIQWNQWNKDARHNLLLW